jgi:hypothetical protein
MSDEYISREAALTALQDSDLFNTTERQLRAIRELPAADVAEVHHARWEEADWHEYDAQSGETIRFPKAAIVCTNCRCAFKKDALWSRNYCPSCGAKMDGGVDHA